MPDSIFYLDCSSNSVTVITSPLPPLLLVLRCDSNALACLPQLPASLKALNCSWNILTNLPPLPEGLEQLYCIDERITCFPPFPNSILPADALPIESGPAYLEYSIRIEGNPATCLPNYLPLAMRPQELTMPLCKPGECAIAESEGSCSAELSIYPNPNHGKFTIKLDKAINFSYEFFDLHGHRLMSGEGYKKLTLDALFIPEGLYMMNISTSDGIFNKKVVILR